jgi:diphosphomevalonate decarboxylase
MRATAIAHPNIALVKYWGKRERALNLPAVPSLSVTLDGFSTRTTVQWGAAAESFRLNGEVAPPAAAEKVRRFLDLVDPDRPPCAVDSVNDFPTAAGLASSSSAFAALAVAGAAAAGRALPPSALSALARQGSGSACRSVFGGFVEWVMGALPDGSDCHGQPVAPADHWDLSVVVALVSDKPKATSSTLGMIHTQETCPLYPGWVSSAPADVDAARAAVLARDLPALVAAMERSTNKMHATMIATDPTIRYWRPQSVAVMELVEGLRARGLPCGWTMDAGPNVKILTPTGLAPEVAAAVEGLGLPARHLRLGGGARLVG